MTYEFVGGPFDGASFEAVDFGPGFFLVRNNNWYWYEKTGMILKSGRRELRFHSQFKGPPDI